MDDTPRQAELYEQILSSLSSGVLAVDAQGSVVTANPAAAHHLNVAADSLYPGQRLDAVPGAATSLLPLLEELRARERTVSRREVAVTTPEGQKVLGVTASPLQGEAGFHGAIFLFIDLTELRRLEKTAELNKQLAQIGELTAGVVHELRNPLSVIAGMSELLLRKSAPGDAVHAKAETIFNETRQMELLVGQFLSFAKPFELSQSLCSAADLLDRSVALVASLAGNKGVAVETTLALGLPELHVDPAKMAQALSNILRNAIEVSGAGSVVRIDVSSDSQRLLLRVSDEGPGIHVAEDDDLFSAFFSKKEGGTGLGLSIVHRIVTAHEGEVTYGNNDGGPGAWFEISLPLDIPGAPV